ncbi:MAG: tRNA (adenosine(37)-N6)-dimethylallyltransferase MiaA [Melioribacteraceae bacterium]|nr:tRNA (adenosine(37)-N6)-dimethylallyltransferase MiaA [Melioribacteraceae bacterium]
MERKSLVIVGPTCSGKTDLSLILAEELGTEIVSADSRQIYKHLNIGTAKPSRGQLTKVKHHLIDALEPDENYNVSKFEHDSLEVIESILSMGKIPIIVGGSGLYIRAIVDGIFDEVDRDDDYRKELMKIKANEGNEKLYQMLIEIDSLAAKTMLPQNWKRVIRALEVFRLSGKSILEFHKDHKREVDVDFIQIGLNWDRETLYSNIENRVDLMIKAGLVDEVKSLRKMGYSTKNNALNTVGYNEIFSFLDGEISLERAIELIKRNTRRFSKRQMTWFRKDERIKWLNVENEASLKQIAKTVKTLL